MIIRPLLRASSASVIPRLALRTPQRCPNNLAHCTRPLVVSFPSQRSYSTPIGNNPNTEFPSRPSPFIQPPPPPPKKRSLRPYIYATLFTLLGVLGGQYVNLIVAPPPLPLPDSHEDKLMVEYLTQKAEELPIVQSLMGDPAWEHHEAYEGVADDVRPHRFTTGPLGGARGIGAFQRVFYNESTGEQIIIVWIGGALAGWPGVTHGGVTATLMDEALGRRAIAQFPGKSGVTANLELNYLAPLVTNSVYLIRTRNEIEGASESKQWVTGRIETLEGRVCVEAKALFVVPKKFLTKPIGKI